MPLLKWDQTSKKIYETGTKKGVLYVMKDDGTYDTGVVWNGLTAVTESNSGAEETALWADDIKYASLRSAEEFGATIEAYQCPKEFYACDGSAELGSGTGVFVNQQGRRGFGFSYVTTLGNDVAGTDYGYKIHIIYGATASPSERAYQTINDSPDAITLSWEITTTPIEVPGLKPTSHLIIDSTLITAAKLKTIEDELYGTDPVSGGAEGSDPTLPTPTRIKQILESN